MRKKQGGTRKWCTNCKSESVVKCEPPPISIPSISRISSGISEDEDIYYFGRCQECQTCGHYWTSAEVPLSLLHELRYLRAKLRYIEKAAEAHSEEPEYGSLRLL
jgi:hypothetical protein